MVKVTLPLEGFKEIEQYDARVFFARFDCTVVENTVECTEMGVMIDGKPTYPRLVAALITGRYDYDAQMAMMANRGDGDPEHTAAFEEFQEWRAEAKRLARIIFPKQ